MQKWLWNHYSYNIPQTVILVASICTEQALSLTKRVTLAATTEYSEIRSPSGVPQLETLAQGEIASKLNICIKLHKSPLSASPRVCLLSFQFTIKTAIFEKVKQNTLFSHLPLNAPKIPWSQILPYFSLIHKARFSRLLKFLYSHL